MSEPFVGEIKLISFGYAPKGWAFCAGQLLPINQNQALFSILGTTYGGDGRVTFALPDLRSRVPVHASTGTTGLGETGGEATHTLAYAELPIHSHLRGSVDQASSGAPAGRVFAAKARRGVDTYAPPPAGPQLNDGAAAVVGGAQAHPNLQPYLVLNYVIALVGLFPSRN